MVGVWETTNYHRNLINFMQQELMHLLAGPVTFTDGHGEPQTFHAGDTLFVTLGKPNSWKSVATPAQNLLHLADTIILLRSSLILPSPASVLLPASSILLQVAADYWSCQLCCSREKVPCRALPPTNCRTVPARDQLSSPLLSTSISNSAKPR